MRQKKLVAASTTLLVIGIVVGLRLISRFEEATEQADETRRKSATEERRRKRRRKLKELSDPPAG